ncbi:TPA: hypothetical protein ACX6RJ_002910 [Photobacterium damselae]
MKDHFKQVLVVIPFGLSQGVISSQVIKLKKLFNSDCNVDFCYIKNGQFFSYDKNDSKGNISHYFKENVIDLIYIRSHFDYMSIKRNGIKVPVYYDFRGAVFAESYLRNKSFIRSLILLIMEFYIYHTSDYRATVSISYAGWLRKWFRGSRKIYSVPCCIDEATVFFNPEKLTGNKFVYVGGASKYQNIEMMVKLLESLSRKRQVELTIISNHSDKIREIIGSQSSFKVDYLSLQQSEVSDHLRKYDFGFILRDDLLLNRVSSPIKVLEYTSAGVTPIITPYVGDYSKMLLDRKIAICVDGNLTWGMIDEFYNDDTLRSRLYEFSKLYTWDKYKGVMKNIYDDINSEK